MPKTDAPADDAVRAYLTFLDDPSKLVDEAEVKRLQAQVDKAKDPIERLIARAALIKAQAADGDALKADFIKQAKRWADAESLPVTAFRTFGVPEDVLTAAGLTGSGRQGRGSAAPSTRRGRVNIDQLESGILSIEGRFSVRDVTTRVGGSPITVKAAIERLEAQGKLKAAGEKAGNRGRAAKVWEVVPD